MLVHPWDAALSEAEWRGFVESHAFGHLVASGRGREVPVVVPTQFLLRDSEVLLHLARPNPIWAPLSENARVVLSVAGDWAYVPAAWKAVGPEDPALGIPTTYYAAVQLVCTAEVVDSDEGKLEILRAQLGGLEPASGVADPSVHRQRLSGIRGVRLRIDEAVGKFKYGGNVDAEHRMTVSSRLEARGGPGDAAAREHLMRRLGDRSG